MNKLRKWSRSIHRDLSYFLAGMILIYAMSGIALNHRREFNPNYSVDRIEYKIEKSIPSKDKINKEYVVKNILTDIDEQDNYTKHYFPVDGQMKVFLKGGSNLFVNMQTNEAVYEKVTERPFFSAITGLHYNPGSWWTTFSDIFAVGLILITLTGIIMVKGGKGLIGRGGIELIIGIVIPLLFLFL